MNKIITLITVLLINAIAQSAGSAIALPINAQTKSINLTINNQKNEDFYSFVNRGEKLAISQINNTFIKFPEIQEISLQILGENQGEIAPIILIKVSKLQWQKQPQIEKYVKYIPESEILLGFVVPPTKIVVQQTQIKVVNSGFQEMAESHLEKNFYDK